MFSFVIVKLRSISLGSRSGDIGCGIWRVGRTPLIDITRSQDNVVCNTYKNVEDDGWKERQYVICSWIGREVWDELEVWGEGGGGEGGGWGRRRRGRRRRG